MRSAGEVQMMRGERWTSCQVRDTEDDECEVHIRQKYSEYNSNVDFRAIDDEGARSTLRVFLKPRNDHNDNGQQSANICSCRRITSTMLIVVERGRAGKILTPGLAAVCSLLMVACSLLAAHR